MQQRLGLFLVLCLATIWLASCGSGDDVQTPNLDVNVEGEPLDASEEYQAYCLELWERAQHDDYDIISGTINVSKGGTLSGCAPSWVYNRVFSISIERDAFNWREHYDSPIVPFEIWVPKDVGQSDYPPPHFKLRPAGIEFNIPASVKLHWPYWLNTPLVNVICTNSIHRWGFPGYFCYAGEQLTPGIEVPRPNEPATIPPIVSDESKFGGTTPIGDPVKPPDTP